MKQLEQLLEMLNPNNVGQQGEYLWWHDLDESNAIYKTRDNKFWIGNENLEFTYLCSGPNFKEYSELRQFLNIEGVIHSNDRQ